MDEPDTALRTTSSPEPAQPAIAPAPRVAVLAPEGSQAANDDLARARARDEANPLWIMTAGMAVFFGVAAILVAMS